MTCDAVEVVVVPVGVKDRNRSPRPASVLHAHMQCVLKSRFLGISALDLVAYRIHSGLSHSLRLCEKFLIEIGWSEIWSASFPLALYPTSHHLAAVSVRCT